MSLTVPCASFGTAGVLGGVLPDAHIACSRRRSTACRVLRHRDGVACSCHRAGTAPRRSRACHTAPAAAALSRPLSGSAASTLTPTAGVAALGLQVTISISTVVSADRIRSPRASAVTSDRRRRLFGEHAAIRRDDQRRSVRRCP